MTTLDIIVPVFREADGIDAFYESLSAALKPISGNYDPRILFVMDPSDDGTLDRLRLLSEKDARVAVIVMSSRFGHQMALVAGMDHSDADACIMLDSDLQHPPSLIPEMVAKFAEGFDVVATLRRDTGATSPIKRFSSRLFYRSLNRISEVPVLAGGADFRLLSRRVVSVFQNQIRERNQFLRGLIPWVGFRSTTITYDVAPRHKGDSKYTLGRSLRFAAQGIVSSSKKPLTASIGTGAVVAALGLLYALWTLVVFFVDGELPSGYTSLAIILSTLGGIQLIFLGVIGLYIGALFDEAKQRPHYIVDEVIGSCTRSQAHVTTRQP